MIKDRETEKQYERLSEKEESVCRVELKYYQIKPTEWIIKFLEKEPETYKVKTK